MKINRALISVFDKSGVAELSRALAAQGVELVSTGGTARLLREEGQKVADISELTGFPEMMDGRVKTLHPKVHGGLLAIRGNAAHARAQAEHAIPNIDLLVVNLYPFEDTVASGADFDACIGNIDIGGPAMIRSAAKNHAGVTVVVDPQDYDQLLADMARHDGAASAQLRRKLAARAFAHTAAYDAAIATWFAQQLDQKTPDRRVFAGRLAQNLRYGENPHQWAAFYNTGETRPGVASARQVQGKELSYNNLNDTDAAYELVAEFDPGETAAAAIVKHANPCGVATGSSLAQAYALALRCDPVSAFGGIVALNRRLDVECANAILQIFTEVVIAPDADDDALALLKKKKNLRVLLAGGLPDAGADGVTMKMLSGGFLVQARDNGCSGALELNIVTKRAPTDAELADLEFAFTIAKHVKSNAVVYARNGASVGIGAGQMSRVDAVRIAGWKAQEAGLKEMLKGCVMASDAFFPFADGLMTAVEAGARAVIQPGGSRRDGEVIAAADKAGIAMVFTGMRHFRH
ncbi:MAG: bifunctional phosphoribosylaminoimidazolecarboxamide formyltransferase/IMP cyclohydrolase [Proteobacteria bacterium]|nr:bifunctional phosphoribosylaminoimidazolecarboxamide formyltransferase/IMP cyclohydrolase [Pseudomonadota bacterium]